MPFAGKKILVTGGAGFVGANLVRCLLKEKAEVHLFLKQKSNTSRLTDVLSSVVVHTVDMREPAAVAEIFDSIKPDGIFHLASVNQSFDFVPTVKDLVDTNIFATVAFMDLLQTREVDFFINTSTTVEVGPQKHAIREDDLPEPTEFYSISRIPGTLYGQALGRQKKKPILTFRIATPYGPWTQKGRIMYQVVTQALSGETLTLTKPTVDRDFIFVEDLIDLLLTGAAKAQEYPGEIFNAGTGELKTLQELFDAVQRLSGSSSTVLWSNQDVSYDGVRRDVDLAKVRRLLSWEPKHSFEEGIALTIDWFRNNRAYWEVTSSS